MHLGLGPAEAALAHEGGHQAVVLGELGELAVGQQVEPRVADVDHGDGVAALGVDQGHGAQRGAHAGELGIVGRPLDDRPVGLLHGGDEHVGAGRAELVLEGLDGEVAGDLARLVAAHAVGDGEEAVDRQEGVLVGLADLADVGGRAPGEAGHRSSITVLPTWSRSPRWSTIGPDTFWRFSQVPLVEPRSSTSNWPSRRNTRAWICEA